LDFLLARIAWRHGPIAIAIATATDVDVWPSPVTGLAAMLQCRDRRVGITWYRRRRVSPFERMNLLV